MLRPLQRCLIPLLSILLLAPALAQSNDSNTSDHAKKMVESNLVDTVHFTQQVQILAKFLEDRQFAKAEATGQALLAQTISFPDTYFQVWARRLLAEVYYKNNQLDKITDLGEQVYDLGEQCQSPRCLGEKLKITSLMRMPLWEQGNRIDAVELLERFRQTPGITQYQYYEAGRLISFELTVMGDYDGALTHLQQVKAYAQEVGNQRMLCNLYHELQSVYSYLGQKWKSLEISKARLATCTKTQSSVGHATLSLASGYQSAGLLDSAYLTYQKALTHLDPKKDKSFIQSVAYRLLVLSISLDREEADLYANELLQFIETQPSGPDSINNIANLSAGLSKYYLYKGQPDLAVKYAKDQLFHSRFSEQDTSIRVMYALSNLSDALTAQGDWRAALEITQEHHAYEMALVRRNQEEATARAAIQLELDENNLARARAEATVTQERVLANTRQRYYWAILSLAALVLSVALWAYNRARSDKLRITKQNALIQDSLEEKEVLLREIHHRVKNNLQVISGLLDQQARRSKNDELKVMVRKGQERIHSMALVHQNLYQSDNLSQVEIRKYLQELSTNIQHSQTIASENITLDMDIDNVQVDIDTAIPLGLILNELITNAYKYAFPDQRKGRIKISFKRLAETGYRLDVQDNGIGLSKGQVPEHHNSLGISLVRGLVRQLGGELHWPSVAEGTLVSIMLKA